MCVAVAVSIGPFFAAVPSVKDVANAMCLVVSILCDNSWVWHARRGGDRSGYPFVLYSSTKRGVAYVHSVRV